VITTARDAAVSEKDMVQKSRLRAFQDILFEGRILRIDVSLYVLVTSWPASSLPVCSTSEILRYVL